MAERNALLEDTRDKQPKSRFEVLNGEIKPHLDTLMELKDRVQEEISAMPLSEYIKHFLAIHCGFEEDSMEYNIMDWIEFAGNGFKPVNLTNDKGEVVLQVPPMFPSDVYILTNEDKSLDVGAETLGDTVKNIDRLGETYKVRAEQEKMSLYEALSSRLSQDKIENHRKRWREFFDKLGLLNPDNYREEIGEKTVKESTASITNVEEADLFQFDED